MAKIRITKVTNDFPEWVKEALIGLELPLAEVPEDQKPLQAHNFQGSLSDSCTSPKTSYHVELTEVLQVLQEKSPRAASWLKEKTFAGPLANLCPGWIGFTAEECSLVDN